MINPLERAKHRSDSSVQLEAQKVILSLAAQQLPAHWMVPPVGKKVLRIELSEQAYVEVDGQSENPRVLAEVYASPRHRGLLAGQKKKLATDVLKLITVRRLVKEWSCARCVLLFSSDKARAGVSGWIEEAARLWDIERIVVSGVDSGLNEMLASAQELQASQWSDDES